MISSRKPYVIIPKLIEQATWGGTYILELKNWQQLSSLRDIKIGQSYELFGDSKLALGIHDTTSKEFIPELGSADKSDIDSDSFSLRDHEDFVTLSEIIKENPEQWLGSTVVQNYGTMPLLVKINQASGNSFQLHIKPSQTDARWKAKPESWYYLEDGTITCGIKPGIDIQEYKKACHEINDYMKQLSNDVNSGKISLESAKHQAKQFITEKNPWQFVNTYETKQYDLIDLSAGGIHHSWESNKEQHPLGNIVYEVQLDVMDPVCTIRSFDQGNLKNDGSIREIHIEDYFKYIDTESEHNDINHLRKQRHGNNLLKTAFYSVDILEVRGTVEDKTNDSFVHLYVRDGDVNVQTPEGTVRLTRGHSCFIPYAVGTYEITSNTEDSVVLKTYI